MPRKVRIVKAMFFPVVIYGCEGWTIKRLSTKELMLLNCGVGEDHSNKDPVQPKINKYF